MPMSKSKLDRRSLAKRYPWHIVIGSGFLLGSIIIAIHYRDDFKQIVPHIALLLTVSIAIHVLDRPLLLKEVRNDLASEVDRIMRNALPIHDAARDAGISHIHKSREEVVPEIIELIRSARTRVWLLGQNLADHLNLESISPPLLEKIAEKRDVRLLLLDALRGPAIFRFLLNYDLISNWRFFANGSKPSQQDIQPYFNSHIWQQFVHNVTFFQRHGNLGFRDHVRFYPHDPMMWLVIVDDQAFLQPYTFRRDLKSSEPLPVFRFEKSLNPDAFLGLLSQFESLWCGATDDDFTTAARVVAKDKHVLDVLNRRLSWWRTVWSQIAHAANKGPERRRSLDDTGISPVRHVVRPDRHYEFKITKFGSNAELVRGTLVDFSRNGISIRVRNVAPDKIRKLLNQNEVVRVEFVGSGIEPEGEILLGGILDANSHRFTVRAVGDLDGDSRVALQATPVVSSTKT